MIDIAEYFGPWRYTPDANPVVVANAEAFLPKVNALLARYEADTGNKVGCNPVTSNAMHSYDEVSGDKFGGFRPQWCPQGAANSSHKTGRGVDVFDPDNAIDDWLTDAMLEEYGLYREDPSKTHTWCHLTDRAPGSGKRTFLP